MNRIIIIPGDGIGEEITAAAVRIMQKISETCHDETQFDYFSAGGAAIDQCGVPLPEETITAASHADAVLLGAVGGPKWDSVPPDIRPEKAILGLRKELGLYANLRPVRVIPSLIDFSPLKPERITGVDLLIVRELNGGIYYGTRCESEYINNCEQAWDVELYKVSEIERVVRLACDLANTRRKKLVCVDKANVLASSRLWRRTAQPIFGEYQELETSFMYVDNGAMQIALLPRQFDVIVTSNLFGDILSDEAAVLAGSIGMLPSASIGNGPGLYEPIHGSAPDIAGKGIANPIGTILSAAMLYRYSLHNETAAANIEEAVDAVLAKGYRTPDLYQDGFIKVSTEEMARLIELEIK